MLDGLTLNYRYALMMEKVALETKKADLFPKRPAFLL